MTNYQPLTGPAPTTSVLLANLAAPSPIWPTNTQLISTTPTQSVTGYSEIPQLPDTTVTALVNQQAVITANLSNAGLIEYGVLSCPTGLTLEQASAPGQYIKPGAGDFLRELQQLTPDLDFEEVASPTLMTGYGGITDPTALLDNVPAQFNAITNSIKNTTFELTESGILNGSESATQSAGVIFAGSLVGSSKVYELLENPTSIASYIGDPSSIVGQAIASGKFAGKLADNVFSGASGVAASLNGLVDASIPDLNVGVAANLSDLTNFSDFNLNSAMQNAFEIAEKSFGELKAGEPNTLGGLPFTQTTYSKSISLMYQLEAAQEELIEAERELNQARKNLATEDIETSYQSLREYEAKVAAAEQRVANLEHDMLVGANSGLGNIDISELSMQDAYTLSAAAASGQLTQPTTANTGVNALPGGLNAFAAEVGGQASNIFKSLKSAATSLNTKLTSTFGLIANPEKLVGSLVSNVDKILGSAATAIGSSVNGITSALGDIGSNLQSAIGQVAGGISNGVSGLVSGIAGALGSIGNGPGSVKSAVFGNNTWAETKAVVNSTINSALDPKVPPPIFDVITPSFEPDEYQRAQLDAQLTLIDLSEVRANIAYTLQQLTGEFLDTGNADLIDAIQSTNDSLVEIDLQIAAAQRTYDRLLSVG